MFAATAIVQLMLHYLGWLGIILGVVAFVLGNRDRALDLIIGGFGFIILKYVIGLIFVGFSSLWYKGHSEESP